MFSIKLWCCTVVVVWSMQQAWRFSTYYVQAIEAGAVPDGQLLRRAWSKRHVAGACPFWGWFALSLIAVMGLIVWSNYELLWPELQLKGGPELAVSMLVNLRDGLFLFGTFCVPAVLMALWRIDGRVQLLPDGLLVLWALIGALQSLVTGRWSVTLTIGQLWLFMVLLWFVGWCVEKQILTALTQWIGAGDLKFLWAAFFWLSVGQIMLMWLYAALGCWLHQAGRQGRILPRGHCALGPYLILGWVMVVIGSLA